MEIFANLNTPLGILALLLAFGVVLANGFTDAPNAIATTVCTGTLSMNRACLLSAICNLLGLGVVSLLNMSVANNIFESASFGEREEVALCAVLASVVIFSVACWLFSMPSSESHALIAGIAGASLALSGSLNLSFFLKIILYTFIACAFSFFISYATSKALKLYLPYSRLQVASCLGTSFMHGAQDGQKFVGILLFLSRGGKDVSPLPLIIMVGVMLFLGTLLGGGRIVKSMGEGIVRLSPKSAFISDMGATISLIICSIIGIPVSTSNIKACSVAGAGLGENQRVNHKILVKMTYIAIITFPVCTLISYLLVRLLA